MDRCGSTGSTAHEWHRHSTFQPAQQHGSCAPKQEAIVSTQPRAISLWNGPTFAEVQPTAAVQAWQRCAEEPSGPFHCDDQLVCFVAGIGSSCTWCYRAGVATALEAGAAAQASDEWAEEQEALAAIHGDEISFPSPSHAALSLPLPSEAAKLLRRQPEVIKSTF